jgi:hypothetical protein
MLGGGVAGVNVIGIVLMLEGTIPKGMTFNRLKWHILCFIYPAQELLNIPCIESWHSASG